MKHILLTLLTGCLPIMWGCASAPVQTDTIKTDVIKTDTSISSKDVTITGKYLNPLSSVIYIELRMMGLSLIDSAEGQ